MITGGAGLLGRWTNRYWSGEPPILTTTSTLDLLVPGNARALVERFRPGLVVHLAWCASGKADYWNSPENAQWVESSLELALACREFGAHLVCAGSVADDSAERQDEYSRSKMQLRSALAVEIEACDVTWIRPHYVFDPALDRPRLVAQARGAAKTGKVLQLGFPSACHDFVHAADVGRAIALIARTRLTGVIDIGSGKVHTVSRVAEVLGAAWLPGDSVGRDPSTPPADVEVLTGAGWLPTCTEGFFAHG